MFSPIEFFIIKTTLAVVFLFLIPRTFDCLMGVSFKNDVFSQITKNPMAAAVYASSRLIAVAVLLSGVLGL